MNITDSAPQGLYTLTSVWLEFQKKPPVSLVRFFLLDKAGIDLPHPFMPKSGIVMARLSMGPKQIELMMLEESPLSEAGGRPSSTRILRGLKGKPLLLTLPENVGRPKNCMDTTTYQGYDLSVPAP